MRIFSKRSSLYVAHEQFAGSPDSDWGGVFRSGIAKSLSLRGTMMEVWVLAQVVF
ncbi:MAG: hypothetical protein KDA91_15350 [Planctomycetaceae bacterium]|nr:hypothetical protein [Planctomycetaceae bacterium]